ncbi:ferredoxin-thioredoxin reductase catalytic domain-containing protein [Pleurocapsa sp. PCC 7319]|uniref:ferredoxin-thioredoxin reductase catalytic domain-containing protein n=1 Tax=Pleurocapsa sp. PCC 7319 TaxID=118161 RepID=UPI0003448D23|nr:ferredoxin-thioredoxin reductase catalytic domain-containing protein [Pleurocapsa sp. PCC 7319]
MTTTESVSQGKSPDKILESMKKFAEQYAKRTDTYFCSDLSVTAAVIKGLAKHKQELGCPLCPCRHYEDKQAEVKKAYWNCPCVPMREEKKCHCMLFLTPDNAFAGDTQQISTEQINQFCQGMQ